MNATTIRADATRHASEFAREKHFFDTSDQESLYVISSRARRSITTVERDDVYLSAVAERSRRPTRVQKEDARVAASFRVRSRRASPRAAAASRRRSTTWRTPRTTRTSSAGP
eukprot:30827-Pelagococcus_subviridis.AAC.17